MQIAFDADAVMETNLKAPALASHTLATRKGIWTIELFHTYWNGLDVRFFIDTRLDGLPLEWGMGARWRATRIAPGDLVREFCGLGAPISGDPLAPFPVSRAREKSLREIGVALKVGWEAAGGAEFLSPSELAEAGLERRDVCARARRYQADLDASA
jgi:hypothetical protein